MDISICRFSPLRTPHVQKSKTSKPSTMEVVSDTESVVTRDVLNLTSEVTKKLSADDNNPESDFDLPASQDLFLTQNRYTKLAERAEEEVSDSSDGSSSPIIPSQAPIASKLSVVSNSNQITPKKSSDLNPKNAGFKAPEGFSSLTDLSEYVPFREVDGKQLWLIQAPLDFDIAALSGRKVKLDGVEKVLLEEDGAKVEFEFIAHRKQNENEEVAADCCCTAPDDQGKFVLGPSLINRLTVVRVPEEPGPIKLGEYIPPVHNLPPDLRPRYKPFGSESPVPIVTEEAQETKRTKKKRKRQSEVELPNGVDSEQATSGTTTADVSESRATPDTSLTADAETSSHRQKKKKKKKKHLEDVSQEMLESEDIMSSNIVDVSTNGHELIQEADVHSQVKKKKKKKKHKV